MADRPGVVNHGLLTHTFFLIALPNQHFYLFLPVIHLRSPHQHLQRLAVELLLHQQFALKIEGLVVIGEQGYALVNLG